MNSRIYLIVAAYLCFNGFPLTTLADTVFLKNGKEIKVEKAWQDGDQIWLIYQGLEASLPHSKVMRIDRTARAGAIKDHDKAAKHRYEPQPAGTGRPTQKKLTTEIAAAPQQPVGPTKINSFLRADGFGDLTWGDRVDSIRGLERKLSDSDMKDVIEYIRPEDILKIDNAILKSIVYAFWRDKLYTVTVWTQGRANYNALRQAVFNHFGKGILPEPSIERHLWSDGPSDRMLKYTKDGEYGMLWMRGKEMDRKFKLAKLSGHTSYLKLLKSRN